MPANLDLRVAYLEPDEKSRDQLAARLVSFFQLAGLAARVDFVTTADEVIETALSGQVDIFVCDLSLNDSSPLGLGVISDVKKRCPWLFCIAVSRGDGVRLTEVDARPHGYDLFVPKQALAGGASALTGTPSYLARFQDRFRYSPLRTYKLHGDVPKVQRGISVDRSELLALLRQVVSYRLPVDPSVIAGEVELTALGGGRSASRVFIVQTRIANRRRPAQPCVLKVSERSSAYEEERRYDSYVRWALPQHVRVDLMATGYTVDQGAVLYSFAYGTGKISTLRDLLEAANQVGSLAAIDRLLNSIGSFWLPLDGSGAPASLSERYLARYYKSALEWFNEDSAKIIAFGERVRLPIRNKNHHVVIAGEDYPSLPGLFQQDGSNAENLQDEWSVVHGDLNPGNIVVSASAEIALIDFRDAGVGHRYEDLVTLEGCIRMFWRWEDDPRDPAEVFAACLEAENDLNAGHLDRLPDTPGWALIASVRTRFAARDRRGLGRSFYFGLACYSFRLLRIEELSDAKRSRILATAYAAAKAFRDFDD
jgi:hypothetical protein